MSDPLTTAEEGAKEPDQIANIVQEGKGAPLTEGRRAELQSLADCLADDDMFVDAHNIRDALLALASNEDRAATAEAEVERLLRERQLCDARIHNQRAVLRDWGPGVRAEKTADFVVKTIALIRKKSKALRAAESEASVLRERVARLEHGLEAIGFLYDGRPRDGSNLVDDFPAWARQALKDGRNVE